MTIPITVPRRRRRRLDAAVLAAATVLGLWFGVGAPAVSPVAPTTAVITAGASVPTTVQPRSTMIDTVDHHRSGGHGGHG